MNAKTIAKGAFLAFCLIGMLVLPASAAADGQGTVSVKATTIDQGLKDDLWNSHTQHRLEAFDMHVRHANDIIGILNSHGIDTSQMQATLAEISAKRPELQSALENRDKAALQKVNDELRQLAKEFLKEMRDAIRSHYAAGTAGTASTTGIRGMTGTTEGIAAL
jgi:hypothetical protein